MNTSDTKGHSWTPRNLSTQSKLASLQLEVLEGVKEVYFENRERDNLPPLIVGSATWEDFSLPHRSSYFLQYTDTAMWCSDLEDS
jgi:hypothetical protein